MEVNFRLVADPGSDGGGGCGVRTGPLLAVERWVSVMLFVTDWIDGREESGADQSMQWQRAVAWGSPGGRSVLASMHWLSWAGG